MKKILLLPVFIVFLIACNSKKDNSSQQYRESEKNDSSLGEIEGSNKAGYTFQLHLDGIRYDSLLLGAESIARDRAFRIEGKSQDGSNWKFSIPDSVYRSASKFFLVPKLKGDKPENNHMLSFFSYQNGDTLNYSQFLPFDHKIVDIYAKYSDTQVFENKLMYKAGTNETSYATLYIYRCKISFDKNPDFEIRAYYPMFPYIPGHENDTYENRIAQCLAIIKKYPDSHYLIGCIAEHRTVFTKKSLQELFEAFSKENQQSDFGKIIDTHLKHYFVFLNMKLPQYDNDSLELVIRDSTKMNLIVFSASWCVPCHKLIPALKEIYHDLKDRLDITYISVDETETANNWRKLMKEQAIPWRSLMAEHDMKNVQATYNPSGTIPFALLVYPDKTVEIIDIRLNDQKEKLYSVCKE